jgi:hypothetical protein
MRKGDGKGELKKPPVKPDNLRSFDVYVDDEYFKVEVNDLYKPNQGMLDFYSSVSVNPGQSAASLSSPQAKDSKSSIQAREGEIAVKSGRKDRDNRSNENE